MNMKTILGGLSLAMLTMAPRAVRATEGYDLEEAREAVIRLAELTGDSVLGSERTGNEPSHVFLTGGETAETLPSADAEPADTAADGTDDDTAAADVAVPVRRASFAATAATPLVTINRLCGDHAMDKSVVYTTGSYPHFVCKASTGTITSSLKVADAVSITFEIASGGTWLKLGSPTETSGGYRSVTYSAASNVNKASRYGIIKCRERYRSGESLYELCTWYPIGQCGDYVYKYVNKYRIGYSQDYSVLCYDWTADSGNGTGVRYVPITTDGSVAAKALASATHVHASTDAKLVYEKTNKSAKRQEYYYYANMTANVKSCLTTETLKGWKGRKRTWNFVAPKPSELLDAPAWFDASDNLVTNVLCTWSAVENATRYKLFRNGMLIGTSYGTSFRDLTGTPNKSYTYSVVAEALSSGVAIASSPKLSDTGKSQALALTAIVISPAPSSVYAGRTYPAALGCLATFNDGNTVPVKPTWKVTGKATVSATGNLRVSAAAKGSLTVLATYTFSSVTKKKSVSIPVVAPPVPEPEVTLTGLSIDGPSELKAGDVTNYVATATYSDGAHKIVAAAWEQLTGTTWATLAATGEAATLAVATPLDARRGTLFTATFGSLTATKRVALVPAEGDDTPEPRPVIAVTGSRTLVAHVACSLPVYVDSGLAAPVTVTGLPKGLKYSSVSGKIYGVPVKTGSYTVKVAASNASGKAATVSLTLKVIAFPSWAVGAYDGLAYWDLDSESTNQVCALGRGTASVSSAGALGLTLAFTDDSEKLSVSSFSAATLSGGKVTELAFRGTLKTATGSYPAMGLVTANKLSVCLTETAATPRAPYAQLFRRLGTSSADKKLIKKVSGSSAKTYSIAVPKMTLKIKSSGVATISGKTTTGRKVSGSGRVLVRDGAPYLFFVFTPTSKGGDGFYIYFEYDGVGLNRSYGTF